MQSGHLLYPFVLPRNLPVPRFTPAGLRPSRDADTTRDTVTEDRANAQAMERNLRNFQQRLTEAASKASKIMATSVKTTRLAGNAGIAAAANSSQHAEAAIQVNGRVGRVGNAAANSQTVARDMERRFGIIVDAIGQVYGEAEKAISGSATSCAQAQEALYHLQKAQEDAVHNDIAEDSSAVDLPGQNAMPASA